MSGEEVAELDHDGVLATTDLAVKLDMPDGTVWVPKQFITDEGMPKAGDGPGIVNVKAWWAVKRGLA